jgi:hypothetical protein
MVLAIPVVVTAALAFAVGRFHADEWLLHGIARARGGQWYPDRPRCPGCGYRVHILRHSPIAVAAGNPDPYLCIPCASGRAR